MRIEGLRHQWPDCRRLSAMTDDRSRMFSVAAAYLCKLQHQG